MSAAMTELTSAGILLHRLRGGEREVFLGRMGGPLWTSRPRAWSIPKGLHTPEEAPLDAARREFEEEIGVAAPVLDYALLGAYRQRSGKTVTVFAAECADEIAFVASNTFELEWPRGSGVLRAYPEIERAEWLPLERAREEITAGQVPALDDLERALTAANRPAARRPEARDSAQ
ncbi:putative NUDIX family NTP pyrophosphohydrolase [Rathayibacter sp. PhB93]|nr:NUDIX domain-containing protein [Rathayibacter sp. PhB1]ROQ05314.1 putative NUDIX family NTP pyrophosphohydrolase [Rathayibacter sp. PhB93]TDQ12615.1 putative NUDIX family NTP pyrophosphohydrolase [Rathayibacter sp. PhB1]